MFHGVPAILFPFFFDQVPNAMNAVEQGIGIQLDIWNFTEEELLNAINRILQEQKFLIISIIIF
jgi:UDP:flavonoid glycosyltransferase YjiC (YdhE family)